MQLRTDIRGGVAGDRFYGEPKTVEEVTELVDAGRVEENLDRVSEGSQREVLSNFLKLDPAERWTAAEALGHEFFTVGGADSTTTSLLGW